MEFSWMVWMVERSSYWKALSCASLCARAVPAENAAAKTSTVITLL
ncbi:secreted protein [Marinobacter adhaerens HP15]|uniref:Secreted protein n=1 Tax=Marinobacter adhaerens (strain DSM 23420 / HP15) TaxID=225937 RepID=E4PFY0_MARAH|nr:secreted protein [Marinobacter adhaerens HP15]